MLSQSIKTSIEQAEGMVIATTGVAGINVVPVSIVQVLDEEVRLFNFFMNKTAVNVKEHSEVAFSCWKGLAGVQLKGEATYYDSGDILEEGIAYVASVNPDRVVKGVVVIKPTSAYNLTAGAEAGEEISVKE